MNANNSLFIGLMSGTSADGVDAALVDFTNGCKLVHAIHHPLTPQIKETIFKLSVPGKDNIDELGTLSHQLGLTFAQATQALLDTAKINAEQIKAIGSHGQTIRHRPDIKFPFTLQIGDPNIIATKTGITTVADFRRRDMALGGQGAPLTPLFHQFIFAHPEKKRAIINIGGISNITVLKNDSVIGYDCGPGNTLIDAYTQKYFNKAFDQNGKLAQQGTIQSELLENMIADDFFKKPFPKSTGREHFNIEWLNKHITNQNHHDILATLTELTAITITDEIKKHDIDEVYLCGGGSKNEYLIERIKHHINKSVYTTEKLNVHPQWLEAIAFAWLAKNTIEKTPCDTPAITGATQPSILGAIYPA